MRDFVDPASGGQGFFEVVAFEINVGIDLVGNTVVALVTLESDVVRGGADPQSLASDLKGCLPDAQMVTGSNDADRFSMSPAVILRPAEKVELAHGHGQVGFLGEALDEAVEHGI